MGRPIKKTFIGPEFGKIKVSSYKRSNGDFSPTANSAYIKKQIGTRKFLIANDFDRPSWSEVMILAPKDAVSLNPGEFRITGFDDNGKTYNVEKIFNKTVSLTSDDGTETIKADWDVMSEAGQPRYINYISNSNPAIVALDDTSGLTDGDEVYIKNVPGMTEINDKVYKIKVIDSISIELIGVDSSTYGAFDIYSGGLGELYGVGPKGAIDINVLPPSA